MESPESQLQRTVEAVVFASEAPVSARALAALHAQLYGEDDDAAVTADRVDAAVEQLNATYRDTGRCFRIRAWAEGYRMATIPEVAPVLNAHFQQADTRRLSRSLMETLAIVAYRQPVTKPEVDHVRGVNSDYALRKLLEQDFVTVVGRSDAVGRPLVYGTTDEFLERFGIRALEDLPKPREIEELLDDPAFNAERTALLSAAADGVSAEGVSTEGAGGEEGGTPPEADASSSDADASPPAAPTPRAEAVTPSE